MRKLREIRRNRGLSQRELAQRLGVSRSAVAMWETGSSSPDVDMLQKISRELNVSTDRLLGIVNVPEDFINVKNLYLLDTERTQQVKVAGTITVGYGEISCNETDSIEYDRIDDTERYVYIIVEDNDMFPEIKKGDIALVELCGEPYTNSLVAVVYNGMATVREMKINDKGIVLSCMREDVPDEYYPYSENKLPYIMGKIIEVKRRFNV